MNPLPKRQQEKKEDVRRAKPRPASGAAVRGYNRSVARRLPKIAALAAFAAFSLPSLLAETKPEPQPSTAPPAKEAPTPARSAERSAPQTSGETDPGAIPPQTPPPHESQPPPERPPRRGRRTKEPKAPATPSEPHARLGLAPAIVEFSSLPGVLYRGETLDHWVRAENRTTQAVEGALGIRFLVPKGRELFAGRERIRIPPAGVVRESHPADREDRLKFQIPIDEVRGLGGDVESREPPVPILARTHSARWTARLDLAKNEAAEVSAFLESDGRILADARARLRPIESGLGGLAFDAGVLRDPDGTPVSIVCDLEDRMAREEWRPIRMAQKALGREGSLRIAVYAEGLRAPDGTSLERRLTERSTGSRTIAFVPATPGPRPVYRDLPAIEKALAARPEAILLVLPRGAPESPVEAWELSRTLHVAIERARAFDVRVILSGPVPSPDPDETRSRAATARKSAEEHDIGLLDLSEALPERDLNRLYASPLGPGAPARDPGPEGLTRLADAIAARMWR